MALIDSRGIFYIGNSDDPNVLLLEPAGLHGSCKTEDGNSEWDYNSALASGSRWVLKRFENVTINAVTGQTPLTNPPANPYEGDEFINTVNNLQWIYDGTTWIARPASAGAPETVTMRFVTGQTPITHPPAGTPVSGDTYINTVDRTQWIWNGTEFREYFDKNIYTNDGTLTGFRTVNQNGNNWLINSAGWFKKDIGITPSRYFQITSGGTDGHVIFKSYAVPTSTYGFGLSNGSDNTGTHLSASNGDYVGEWNTGNFCTLSGGYESGWINSGHRLIAGGYKSGLSNWGDDCTFYGMETGYGNRKNKVTAIGAYVYSDQVRSPTETVLAANIDFTNNTFEAPAMVAALGLTSGKRILIDIDFSNIVGLNADSGYPVEHVSGNTMKFLNADIVSGTDFGFWYISEAKQFEDVTLIGNNIEPTKNNQTTLGSATATEAKIYGQLQLPFYDGTTSATGTPETYLAKDANNNVIQRTTAQMAAAFANPTQWITHTDNLRLYYQLGSVGIGGVPSSSFLLDVKGSAIFTGAINAYTADELFSGRNVVGNRRVALRQESDNGVLVLYNSAYANAGGSFENTAQTLLRSSGNSFFNGGNLGILTATPTEALDVNGQLRVRNIPVYATTAAAAADITLLAGEFFRVTNGNGTSALHIKE